MNSVKGKELTLPAAVVAVGLVDGPVAAFLAAAAAIFPVSAAVVVVGLMARPVAAFMAAAAAVFSVSVAAGGRSEGWPEAEFAAGFMAFLFFAMADFLNQRGCAAVGEYAAEICSSKTGKKQQKLQETAGSRESAETAVQQAVYVAARKGNFSPTSGSSFWPEKMAENWATATAK